VRRFVGRRLAATLLVLVASTMVVFGFLHLAPGDPAHILLAGRPTSQEAIDAIRAKYALDQPLPVQYVVWVGRLLTGDFGESMKERAPVLDAVLPRFWTTLELSVYAGLLMLVAGISLGILSAVFRSGAVDSVSSIGALVAASVPSYVTAVVLIAVFAVALNWFPALGSGKGGLDTVYHLTLPAIALALSGIAIVMRATRSSMIEALAAEYVETARIRGFSGSRVILKHALRSALIPVVTISGVMLGYLLSGAILVEYAFGLNGMGNLLVKSVQGLDYAVVQAIALIFTAEFLIISLTVDLLYAVIDPRVRLGMRAEA
jgi:peptide/nickel transport system permease protein